MGFLKWLFGDEPEPKKSAPKEIVVPHRYISRFMMCGTAEEWEAKKHMYPDMLEPIPAKVYVTRRIVCLVTSREWADYLQGKSDIIPSLREEKKHELEDKGQSSDS